MKKVVKGQNWILLVLALLCSFTVAAQSGGIFEISKATIESGGTTSSGGVFEVKGSIGQYEVNGTTDVALYQVTGGFWVSGQGNDLIFENGFE
ncbi:MAG: hypothetical protein R3E90_01840 [Marinicella sp.]|nr:hypothetical protein [Xanthomonadales bacterium]